MLGTLIGVLPGLGPTAGTAILIPLTFSLDPTGALIMLSAIYYGAMYGGTITSVLINVPGEAASVITCFDGYQMAKQGRGGTALGIAAIGSFIGGIVATIALIVVAPPLARLALSFGPPEFFALMLVGLCLITGLAGQSLVTAVIVMAVLGLLIAMVGIDPVRGAPRFTFGVPSLYDGVGFIPVVMGLFGIAEILVTIETALSRGDQDQAHVAAAVSRGMAPLARGHRPRHRHRIFPRADPRGGRHHPDLRGLCDREARIENAGAVRQGAIEGVAAPETANNAYANAAMIPLLTLGIPSSPTIAVLMGAFIINGLTPGPFLFKERPDLVWAVIASFMIGNVMLLILNLPFVGFGRACCVCPISTCAWERCCSALSARTACSRACSTSA